MPCSRGAIAPIKHPSPAGGNGGGWVVAPPGPAEGVGAVAGAVSRQSESFSPPSAAAGGPPAPALLSPGRQTAAGESVPAPPPPQAAPLATGSADAGGGPHSWGAAWTHGVNAEPAPMDGRLSGGGELGAQLAFIQE